MDAEIRRHFRFNFWVNLLDGGFFGFAFGFASLSTVLPLFIATMSDSAVLVGLVPAIHVVGWQLPQLFTAQRVQALNRFKPWVLFMTIHERIPFVFLSLVAWLSPTLGKTTTLWLSFFLLTWQGLGGGLTANAWQNMIGKIIPSEYRATFFGLQSAAANLLGSAGAALAGLILERLVFPGNFALCFLLASLMMGLSYFFISLTREPEHYVETNPRDTKAFWAEVRKILTCDKSFTWYLVGRILFQFSMMAFAFYMVYAVQERGMGKFEAGIMTSVLFITQVIANPLLGWLADRWKRQPVLELGALAVVLSALLAWFAPALSWFYLVMILTGIANTVFWAIGLAITLEFGQESQRPTYVGLANTLIAPAAALSPLVGGWLADQWGYPATFAASTCLGLIALAVLHFFVQSPERGQSITANSTSG
ncbi:MFS transporter [uncultured Thermanaerothrix sp.]|uniref:MFS transporter n=1 Tax=uncultured Thermanaerothrix sp. TaxID=1195149 RepID=UPI00260E07A0|nr:MFS transporter [uncultured Thermanaerothrix sp.]